MASRVCDRKHSALVLCVYLCRSREKLRLLTFLLEILRLRSASVIEMDGDWNLVTTGAVCALLQETTPTKELSKQSFQWPATPDEAKVHGWETLWQA